MSAFRLPLILFLFAAPFAVAADNDVDEIPMGEVVERHLSLDEPFMQWVQDPDRVDTELSDTIEMREGLEDGLETIKLTGLVPAIYFESGVAQIPDETVVSLGEILASMRDRMNLRLHLVGHADSQGLSPRLAAIYVDNMGLSRERAGEVAEYMQTALALPAEGVSYSWHGDTQPVATNANEQGRALNRRVEVEVWYDEVRQKATLQEVLVEHDVQTVKVCRMETVCKLRYVEGHAHRARVQNLIAPLQFEQEATEVDERFVDQVRESLGNLADKQNVIVKFVGYTDDTPLSGRVERIYGDHVGLSKARARRVALAIQDALELPTDMLQSDGRGADKPLASNATAQGRAINRRVEVEFWYDDPLQELPDEPQLCPGDAGAEMVTRVYDPPWGSIDHIDFANGRPIISDSHIGQFRHGLDDVADKTNPRLRFVGYTRNERLERRTAAVYGDDIGLSASRARRAMEQAAEQMGLESGMTEFEGRGYVHSDDVVNAGFIQGETSHVAVQIVYDELAILDDYEGVDITRMTRELKPENPLGLNLMRITVDGEPIDDPNRSSSDIQRCTDVALSAANIQFGYDNLRSSPRLSVTAEPSRIDVVEDHTGADRASTVHFRMYTNYSHFVERAEIRVFRTGQSLESLPLETIDLDVDGIAEWTPYPDDFRAPGDELAYVLRVYGKDDNFDETKPQPLWIVASDTPPEVVEHVEEDADPTLLAAYGENTLGLHNIGLSSGTISVRGDNVPEGHEVWVAGRPVPVDETGSFIAEEILPQGSHTVEVAVLDEDGAGELYLRDLEFEDNDWFYVGMADLTLSTGDANGPAGLLQGDSAPYDYDSNADARLAFFVDGKFGDHWRLTASADTREGPIDDLFSNFMDKTPDSLFRRIDPDYHYPTFGDDSTTQEMAPTMGKFFVRLSEDDNYGQWGNFKIAYMGNELAQVDRGLYGANAHYESDAATEFGEKRYAIDAFAAEPGTVGSYEEFRGTGGSLYFLQRQDLLVGSERVRIEVRDKASGIVTGVINLTPGIDYDIDYLQGRILLTEPLASTTDDNLLVRSGALSGDDAYLVARYEYTPGFEDIDAVSFGGQAHYWLADLLKIGLTSNTNEQNGDDSELNAVDLTLKLGPDTWLKLQQGRSEGLVSLPVQSSDGGFEFDSMSPSSFVNAKADATRADLSFRLRDFIGTHDGRLTLYTQEVDAGYSAPGMAALTDTTNHGGTLSIPVGDRFSFGAKIDKREQDAGIDTEAQEFNVGYRFGENWDVSVGYRMDERVDNTVLVPLTQNEGRREDGVVQLSYDSNADWNIYSYVQDTLSASGSRQENARTGFGGTYQVTEKLQVDAEVSNGDLGAGGRLGSNYLYSDRTSMYLGYTLENERTDLGAYNAQGSEGNLVAGLKTRLADSTSVFLEERYKHGDNNYGLTHSAGINFAPNEKWTLGFNTDLGTLQDALTGAETDRTAAGVQVALQSGGWQLVSGVEYRSDDVEQPDLTRNERETWLLRNSLKFQLNPSSRLFGKLNYADSDSTEGAFFDGGYTEAVFGYALRPVSNDRFNAMAKYTYFYNIPTTGQVGGQNLAAQFIQKSHVAAVDASYDISPKLTIGGKYAYRLGQVSLDREDPDYFDSNASLYVLRGDYRFLENWEFLVETRLLDMPDLDDSKAGALLAVSHYFKDHLKLGLGYNFTDFSDDLTDLSYDHQGVFLNITGSL